MLETLERDFVSVIQRKVIMSTLARYMGRSEYLGEVVKETDFYYMVRVFPDKNTKEHTISIPKWQVVTEDITDITDLLGGRE